MEMLKNKVQNKSYQLALFSFILFLVITIVISTEAYNKLNERNAAFFNLRVDFAQKAMEKRMTDYIQILKGTQGLITMSDTVTRNEFKKYVENLNVEENYPGIQGIGYTLFIRDDNKQKFEDNIRATGFPDFKVWPLGPRKIYSSIVYLEPFNRVNIKAFGYDMYADTVRKAAMRRARDTGMASLSGPIVLVQEGYKGTQKGFNLYLPIYRNGVSPKNLAERRSKIKGYVYSPFRVNDLMNGILQSNFEDLNIQVFDGTIDNLENLLYTKSTKNNSRMGLKKTVTTQQAGRTWYITFRAASGFGHDRNFPFFLFGGGFIISTLVFFILLSFGYVQKSTYLKQVITDNATAGLIIISKRGICTFMNPSAESLTGYSFSEMVNKNILELFYDKEVPENKKSDRLIQTLYGGDIKNFESILYTKLGKKKHISINSKLIEQHASNTSILLEIRNISQEKKAESELKERNKSLQTLNKIGITLSAELELNKLLQIITDSCTELTKAEFGAFYYHQPKEDGAPLMLFTTSGKASKYFSELSTFRKTAIFRPFLSREGIFRSDDITQDTGLGKNAFKIEIPKANLQIKSYLAVPVVSRNGSVIGSLIFCHSKAGRFIEKSEEIVKGVAAQAAIAIDNSQLFESLSNKNAELLKINNDLDNFVYTASHDLKAPVLNIEGLVYALTKALQENRTEKIGQMMEMIKKSILKFKETIQALTEVARTNKNVNDDLEYINLDELVQDINFSIKDIIHDSKAIIKTVFECEEIYFSKSNLRSIIFNLVTNAIKYRSPDREARIDIYCRQEAGNTVITVKDNGIGISKEHHNKIFLMFKRVHMFAEGTGIGLYLVKRIVENEGGTIALQSEIDKGSTFTITLPIKGNRNMLNMG